MAQPKITVAVGTKFNYHHADSIPQWEVKKARGGDTWECVVTPESLDWSGTRKVFGGEEIRNAIANAAMWQDMADDHESWWNARAIGETVHYDNGFGQYVRGRIVWEVSEEFPEGRNVMVPTGLVGNWRDYDLPHIDAAGNLIEGYNVRQIRDGKTMQPNYSNMVEARGVRPGKGEDPRGKPALDIRPPGLNGEQEEAKRLNQIRQLAAGMLQGVEHDPEIPYSETLRTALRQARDLLAKADI